MGRVAGQHSEWSQHWASPRFITEVWSFMRLPWTTDASAWEHRTSIASSEAGDNSPNSGGGNETIAPSWPSTLDLMITISPLALVSGLPASPARKKWEKDDTIFFFSNNENALRVFKLGELWGDKRVENRNIKTGIWSRDPATERREIYNLRDQDDLRVRQTQRHEREEWQRWNEPWLRKCIFKCRFCWLFLTLFSLLEKEPLFRIVPPRADG